jgi:outer membrane lipoprotein SlyB
MKGWIMKRTLMAILVVSTAVALPAAAVDTDAVVGGALGGAAGAAVGSAIGGREGAIVGAGLGGAAGAAVATSDKQPTVRKEVIYVDEHHHHHDNGKHKGHYKRGYGDRD